VRSPFGEPWRAWAALAVGVLAITAHAASSVVLSILMKTMIADLGWNRSEFAAGATVRILAMTAMLPVAGHLVDRLGARAVLTAGAMTIGCCVLAIARVESLTGFLAVSAVMGPGQACVGAVAASALVLRLFRRRHGIALGLLNGGDNVLSAMLPPATTALLATSGWRPTLTALGIAYVLLAAVTFATLRRDDGRESRSCEDQAAAGWGGLPWRDPRLWMVCAIYAATYAWITSIQLHFHAFQTDRGVDPALASQLLSLYLLVGAVGAPLFGWVAERTSARTGLLLVTSGLTVSVVTVLRVQSTPALFAWAVFHGLVNSGVVALLALVLHECFGTARIGQLLGLAMVGCMAATMVGNQASAWAFDHLRTYGPAWRVYEGLMAVATALALWLRLATARGAGSPRAADG
jgi:MFS family permease